jgi:hypothetical protein
VSYRVYDVALRLDNGHMETVRVGANTKRMAGRLAWAKYAHRNPGGPAPVSVARVEFVPREKRTEV